MRTQQDVKTKILLGFLIATVAFIWGHSMMPADLSSNESGWVMAVIKPFLELFVGKDNVTAHLVRKLAHFTEYFVLGAELALFFTWLKSPALDSRKWLRWVLPLLIGLCVASLDETIQIFVDGRGPAVTDVLLDFSGVCAGVLLEHLTYDLFVSK